MYYIEQCHYLVACGGIPTTMLPITCRSNDVRMISDVQLLDVSSDDVVHKRWYVTHPPLILTYTPQNIR